MCAINRTADIGAYVDLGAGLREICSSLVSSHSFGDGVEFVDSFTPGCLVRPDQVAPVTQIVREVVANAIAYAHPTGVRGKLVVSCRKACAGGVIIDVADDGVGLPEGFDPAVDGGPGFRLARSLCQALGATVSFDSTALGLIVRILVPRQPARSGFFGLVGA